MDQGRWPDDVAHDPVHDRDRVLRGAELEDPRLRPVGPRQPELVAIEPDDEDLGLDRAVDVPTNRRAGHGVILFVPGSGGSVP